MILNTGSSKKEKMPKNYSNTLSKAIIGFANEDLEVTGRKYGSDNKLTYLAITEILKEAVSGYKQCDQNGLEAHMEAYVLLLSAVNNVISFLTKGHKLLGVPMSIWESKGYRTHCLTQRGSKETEEISPYQFLIRTILEKECDKDLANILSVRFNQDYREISPRNRSIQEADTDEHTKIVKNIVLKTQPDLFTSQSPSIQPSLACRLNQSSKSYIRE